MSSKNRRLIDKLAIEVFLWFYELTRSKRVRRGDMIVAWFIAISMRADMTIEITMKRLSEAVNMSERALSSAIGRLITAGYLIALRQPGRPNRYMLTYPVDGGADVD